MAKDLARHKKTAKQLNANRGFNTICTDCGYIWERIKTPPGKCPVCQGVNWDNYVVEPGKEESDE